MNDAKPNEVDPEETPTGVNALLEERPSAVQEEAIDQEPIPRQSAGKRESEGASEPSAEIPQKKSIFSRLPRIIMSRTKEDALKSLVSEADAIKQRLDEVEQSVHEMAKSSVAMDKRVGKALKTLIRQMGDANASQVKTIEQVLARLQEDMAAQSSGVRQSYQMILGKVDDAAGVVSGVNGSLTGIRGFLDESNKLARRFEEGYDYQILKNFVRQIARIINDLDMQLKKVDDSDAKEALMEAKEDLIELLDRNGVELITPEIGSPYAGQEKLAEVAQEKIPATASLFVGCVAAVEKVGYRYVFNDGQERVIQAARVKLYE